MSSSCPSSIVALESSSVLLGSFSFFFNSVSKIILVVINHYVNVYKILVSDMKCVTLVELL